MLRRRSIRNLCLFLFLATTPVWGAEGVVSGPLGEKLDRTMTRLESFGFAGSLLVAKDGKVILHKGYGLADRERKTPWTAETVCTIGSITKQFTAAAILKLEMEGKLSVSDPISKYFPKVPADKAGITLHHLLTHSSGLVDGFGGDYDVAPRDWVVEQAMASKLLWPPGTRYRYSNAGYSLLGAVVEIVSGKPYETYLQEKLLKPAGLTKTGYKAPQWPAGTLTRGYNAQGDWGTSLDHPWAPDGPWWNLRANGGILSTVGELYKWHQALEGDAILSKEAKAKAYTPHVPEDEEGSSHYGYGWAVMKTARGTRLIAHDGGNGIFAADFRRYLDEGVVIIINSNQSDFSSIPVSGQVARVVFGMETAELPAVVKVDPKVLARYAGIYALPSGGRFIVTTAPANPAGTPRLAIVAEGKDAFGLLAGGGAPAKTNADLEARVLAALEKSRTGDYAPLAAVYGVPLAQAESEAKESWQRLQERHGPFKGFKLLGTAAAGGRNLTYVRFNFERGTAVIEYAWSESATVDFIRILDGSPEGLFLPVGPAEVASYDPRSRMVRQVAFEAPGDGPAAALKIGEARAGRVEK